MGREKTAQPRSAQLLIRITSREMNVLESVAHLEKTTPNAYARRLLESHLLVVAAHPRVQRDLANRAAYEAEEATTTPLMASQSVGDPAATATPVANQDQR